MLLRRSCYWDGIAAATELHSTSSVALILRDSDIKNQARVNLLARQPRLLARSHLTPLFLTQI